MQFLLVFLGGLLTKVAEWFAKKGLVAVGTTITLISLYIGLYIAFITATTAAVWALQQASPHPFIPFILSFFPPVFFAMINVYFVALVSRRIFDWHRRTLKETHAAMNSMNY